MILIMKTINAKYGLILMDRSYLNNLLNDFDEYSYIDQMNIFRIINYFLS